MFTILFSTMSYIPHIFLLYSQLLLNNKLRQPFALPETRDRRFGSLSQLCRHVHFSRKSLRLFDFADQSRLEGFFFAQFTTLANLQWNLVSSTQTIHFQTKQTFAQSYFIFLRSFLSLCFRIFRRRITIKRAAWMPFSSTLLLLAGRSTVGTDLDISPISEMRDWLGFSMMRLISGISMIFFRGINGLMWGWPISREISRGRKVIRGAPSTIFGRFNSTTKGTIPPTFVSRSEMLDNPLTRHEKAVD